MSDEEIVFRIDTLNTNISIYRLNLSKMYRERRELRKRLEMNHRIKSEL